MGQYDFMETSVELSGELTQIDREEAIKKYSTARSQFVQNTSDEGFAGDIAASAAEPGFQNSFSLLYDKALSNPNAIGMTKDEIKYDRGKAVTRVAKNAYLEIAEDIFVDVLDRYNDPLKAQRTADLALDYFFNNTARIQDPEKRKAHAREVVAGLQSYTEDGVSYGNFYGLAQYMSQEAATRGDENIVPPFGGNLNKLVARKTFVNDDADLDMAARMGYSFGNNFLPALLGEVSFDMFGSGQRQYEAYKDMGYNNLSEVAAGIAGNIVSARLMGWGAGKFSPKNPAISGAVAYLASSVGTGALQDLAESGRGVKQQFFTQINRVDDGPFLSQYINSRLFDIGTAAAGAYTGSLIESKLFGRGLRDLAETKHIGKIIQAQFLAPTLDTTVDLGLDLAAHHSLVAAFGEGEPIFTNAQNLQFAITGKSKSDIAKQLAAMYGFRMSARIGAGALNAAISKLNTQESKYQNLMGTKEWYDQEIGKEYANGFWKTVLKGSTKFANMMFGNNLSDIDTEFRSNKKYTAASFTDFLRSGNTGAVGLKNMASLYMVREAQKNWIVGLFAGLIDGRVKRSMSSDKMKTDIADETVHLISEFRKNEAISVKQESDAKVLGQEVADRITSGNDVDTELDMLLETHVFDKNMTNVLEGWIIGGIADENIRNRVKAYFSDPNSRRGQRVALTTESKVGYIDAMHIGAHARLDTKDLDKTIFKLDATGMSSRAVALRNTEDRMLEFVDNRMRLMNSLGEGLLDIVVGTPESLSALRTAAAQYIADRGRTAASPITTDNAHDRMKSMMEDFANKRIKELTDEVKNIIRDETTPPEVMVEVISRFNAEMSMFAQAFPTLTGVKTSILDAANVYKNASPNVKKAFDTELRKNQKLLDLLNKTGDESSDDIFARLLGFMAACTDEIKYDRVVFASSIGQSNAFGTFNDVMRLLDRGVTITESKKYSASKLGFEIPETNDGVNDPTIELVDSRGNRETTRVSGPDGKFEIENGLLYLKTATETEIDSGMSKTFAFLLRAAMFKADAIRDIITGSGSGRATPMLDAVRDILLDMDARGIIRMDPVTHNFSVRDQDALVDYIKSNQAYMRTILEGVSVDYEGDAPPVRYDDEITVSNKFFGLKTAAGGAAPNVRIKLGNAVDLVIKTGSKAGFNLVNVADMIASGMNRVDAIRTMSKFIKDRGFDKGALNASRRTAVATAMVDDAINMRGRSTTFDMNEDRLIYSSEFSSGVESFYRENGHTFLYISTDKLNETQRTLVEDDSFMHNNYGLVRLTPLGVNHTVTYMKVPDLKDKRSRGIFWNSVISTVRQRINESDPGDYAREMDRILGSLTPPASATDFNNSVANLFNQIARAGNTLADRVLTNMKNSSGWTGDVDTVMKTLKKGMRTVMTPEDARKFANDTSMAMQLSIPNHFTFGMSLATYLDSVSPADRTIVLNAFDAILDSIDGNNNIDIRTAKDNFINTLNPDSHADMQTKLDAIISDTFQPYYPVSREIIKNIGMLVDSMRLIPAGILNFGTLSFDSINSTIKSLSDIGNTQSSLSAAVNIGIRALENLRDLPKIYETMVISTAELTKLANAENVHSNKSKSIDKNEANEDSNTIKADIAQQLSKLSKEFYKVYNPTAGDLGSLRFTVDAIRNRKSTDDNLLALQAFGNLLQFGTKFVWAQNDIIKRGAGTRMIKHRGFEALSKAIAPDRHFVVWDVSLAKANDQDIGAGFHVLNDNAFDIVNKNDGSKPTLATDAGLFKAQFGATNGKDKLIQDLVTHHNTIANTQGRSVEVYDNTGNRVTVADEIVIDSFGRLFYQGSRRTPADEINFMAVDHDSFKQMSLNFASAIHNSQDKTYSRIGRVFDSADAIEDLKGIRKTADVSLDNDILEIRDKGIIADMLGSFRTHKMTNLISKDNTISYQGANDDPNTKAYLSKTIISEGRKMFDELSSALNPHYLTAEGIKDAVQRMSNAVSDAQVSPGVTVTIKNSRQDVGQGRIITIPGSDLKSTALTSKGRTSLVDATDTSYPIHGVVGDGTLIQLAIKHLQDIKGDVVSYIDNTGNVVQADKSIILSAINMTQSYNVTTTRNRAKIAGDIDQPSRDLGINTLLGFIAAQGNSCIKKINGAYFIGLNRSPNIQKGQGQSLPVLIRGVEMNSEQVSISSATTKINLADFDGDTMSTQNIDIDSLRLMIEETLPNKRTVTDDEIVGHLHHIAYMSVSKNRFTNSLAPTKADVFTEDLQGTTEASGIIIGAYNTFNKVMSLQALNGKPEYGDDYDTLIYNKVGRHNDYDAVVMYKESDGWNFKASDFKGTFEDAMYFNKVKIAGDEYHVILADTMDPKGNLVRKAFLCNSETSLTGVGYSVKYVMDIPAEGNTYSNLTYRFSRLEEELMDGRKTLTETAHVADQRLKLTNTALVHKVLQSTSIDAPKYKELYAIFNAMTDFPDPVANFAKLMNAAMYTRTVARVDKNNQGTTMNFVGTSMRVSTDIPEGLGDNQTFIDPKSEKAIGLAVARKRAIDFIVNGDKNYVEAIASSIDSGSVSASDYDKIVRFGSKKTITDASDMMDMFTLLRENSRLKAIAQEYRSGVKDFPDLDPDFLKGLLAAELYVETAGKLRKGAEPETQEMNIKTDEFFSKDGIPFAFKKPDGESKGMPLMIGYAVELRDALKELNDAFGSETMVDHTPTTLRKLSTVMKSTVSFATGRRGTARKDLMERILHRITVNNPGLKVSIEELNSEFDSLGFTLQESRVLTDRAKSDTALLRKRLYSGSTGYTDLSKHKKHALHHGQYKDDDISTYGVILRRGDKDATLGDLFSTLNTQIAHYGQSVQIGAKGKKMSKRLTPNDSRRLSLLQAMALEIGAELPRIQQSAMKISFNGIDQNIANKLIESNGKITGEIANAFFNNRLHESAQYLFRSVFTTREDITIC